MRSEKCQKETNAPQHGGSSGNAGLQSLGLLDCRGDCARLWTLGTLTQAGGGTLGTATKQTFILARNPLASVAGVSSTVAIAVAYFFGARLSLVLLEPVDGVAVFWPAAGVASGILIALGPVARWHVVVAVMAATIAANLLGDRNIWNSLSSAVANAGEAVIVAGLVHRFCGSPFELNELRKVLALFAATVVATSLSGVAGTAGFVLFHGAAASPPVIWFHWFSSDAIGIIAVAPLAIGLASLARNLPPQREIAEGVLALAVVAIVCALLVFLPNEPWTAELAMGALCPLLLWIAARLRPAFTAFATFIVATTIVWTTTFAVGIFGDLHLVDRRACAGGPSCHPGDLAGRPGSCGPVERGTKASRNPITGRAAGRQSYSLRLGTWCRRRNTIQPKSAEILGLNSHGFYRRTEWRHIHPEDHTPVASWLASARPDQPLHSIAFRRRRPDGGEVWLEQVAIIQFEAGGKPTRINGLMTDVTERKRFEAELSLARTSAEIANRAKSGFLAAASHDLRQPLQTLTFLQAALEPHHSGGEARNLVAKIGQSLDTMASILSSLLDVNMLQFRKPASIRERVYGE